MSGNTGRALTDPAPLISPEQAELDRQAFMRSASRHRVEQRKRAEYREVRLAFVRAPKATLHKLKADGKSWDWLCRVLALTKHEAWQIYFGENQ